MILFARSFDLLIIMSSCAVFGIHFLIYIASVKCSGNSNIKQQTRTVICLSSFYILTRDFISIAHSKTLGSMKNLWRRRQHSAKNTNHKQNNTKHNFQIIMRLSNEICVTWISTLHIYIWYFCITPETFVVLRFGNWFCRMITLI